jgi:hypothetical protein
LLGILVSSAVRGGLPAFRRADVHREIGKAERVIEQLSTRTSDSAMWIAKASAGAFDFSSFVWRVSFDKDALLLQMDSGKNPFKRLEYASLGSVEVIEKSILSIKWFGVKVDSDTVWWRTPGKDEAVARNNAVALADALYFVHESKRGNRTTGIFHLLSRATALRRRKPSLTEDVRRLKVKAEFPYSREALFGSRRAL